MTFEELNDNEISDEQRKKCEAWMDKAIEGKDYTKHGDLIYVHMRLHEADVPGFLLELDRLIEHIRIQQN